MVLTFLLSVVLSVIPTQAAQSPAPDIETCLGCHSDKGMTVTLPSGESRSLYVDRQSFRQ